MKFIRTLIIVILLTMSATVFAAAPAPGVYEKRNDDGTMARMTVIVSTGYSNSAIWQAPDFAPCIILQGFENDKEVVEIATRYNENKDGNGIAEYGLAYDEHGLDMFLGRGAVAKRYPSGNDLGNIKADNGNVIFQCSENLNVDKSGILDGTYTPVNSIPKLTGPFVQFVVEQGSCYEIYFSDGNSTDRQEIFAGAVKTKILPDFSAVEIWGNGINRQTCFISNDYSLIMVKNEDKVTFTFPYVSDKFPQSTEHIWNGFEGSNSVNTNAVYLYQHLWKTREDLREMFYYGYAQLLLSDYVLGQPTICQYRVWVKDTENPGFKQVDLINVSSNGKIVSVK